MKQLILTLALALLLLAGCTSTGNVTADTSTDFQKTLDGLAAIDGEQGISILDYTQGVSYLRWNPREIPVNTGDISGIVEQYEALKESTDDRESLLAIDARIHLLESEKYYKMAYKTVKGKLTDGFKCNERPYVVMSIENLNMSLQKGREAMTELDELFEISPDEAKLLNISQFWIKLVNSTYDGVYDELMTKVVTFNHYCPLEEESNIRLIS